MTDMVAGHELDARIASEVMGWKPVSGGWRTRTGQVRAWESVSGDPGFKPSVNITAAWEVMEEVLADEDSYKFAIALMGSCGAIQRLGETYADHVNLVLRVLNHLTPKNVCLIALEAVGGEQA